MSALFTPVPARDRRLVTVGLVLVTALSWGYLFFLSARMSEMQSPFAAPMTSAWTTQDVGLVWTMWAVMMAGMMIPSAAPMIRAYSSTVHSGPGGLRGSTPLFVVGYLATWGLFGAVAAGAQWVLHDTALVDAMGTARGRWFPGLLLLAAGVYQFTRIKDACLRQCRTPLGFLLAEWREGRRGAVVMGMRHGSVCIGCCWALMALLFVLGVMNLWWIALLAAVVLLEKLLPTDAITRVLGIGLIAWGSALTLGLLA